MIPVWYLVVAYYHGGTVLVPQMTRDQCLTGAAFVSSQFLGGMHPTAYCIPGAKQ